MYVVSLARLRRRAGPWIRLFIIACAVLGALFVGSRLLLPPRPAALPLPGDAHRAEAPGAGEIAVCAERFA